MAQLQVGSGSSATISQRSKTVTKQGYTQPLGEQLGGWPLQHAIPGELIMPRKISYAIVLALVLSPFVAVAEQAYVNIEQRLTSEQLRETGLSTLSPEQLKRLNQLLNEESVNFAKIEKSQSSDRPIPASYIGLNDKPIKSRLMGSVSGWEVDTIFELENGQRWKVLKGQMKLRKPMQSPNIIVVPGIAGRWFLQVDEDLPKARVYRID